MEYRRLGNAGVKVSLLGLGTNNFGQRCDYDQSKRVIDQSLDIGATHIDTANIYGGQKSEEFIGKALKGKRQQAFIATKFGMAMGQHPTMKGASRAHMMDQVHGSLKRLDTDYIDLYFLHQPDFDTPIDETMRAFDDLVTQGKVRYIGCSNFAAWQLSDANSAADQKNLTSFTSIQNHYNMLRREAETDVVPYCKFSGVGLIPFFPLASGMLTGKYKQGQPAPVGTRLAGGGYWASMLNEKNFKNVEKLEGFAKERGHTVGELAIAWLASNPTVCSIISGATKPEQVVENARGLEWKLKPEDMKELDKLVPL